MPFVNSFAPPEFIAPVQNIQAFENDYIYSVNPDQFPLMSNELDLGICCGI